MTIGINGNEANVVHRVGVNQYAFELLSHLPKELSDEVIVYLSHPPLEDMPRLTYQVFGPRKLWTLTGLQKKLFKDPPDVLFTPTHYTPLYVPCPSVIAVMDLAFEKFPQYFKARDLYQLRYWTRYSVRQAAKVVTISEYSKRDICEIYGVKPEKIVVTYPGYDKQRFNFRLKDKKLKIRRVLEKYKIKSSDYLFFLGTLQPRKNLERLIEAYLRLDTNCQLVIAGMISEGRGGWMFQNLKAKIFGSKQREKIILTGYVPDDEVPILMAGAIALVLPSLYEGFGIPAIESMACGTPVIVSKVSSLPEICGEAALYIENPYDVESIRDSIEKILNLSSYQRTRLVNIGLEWVKRYNWDITAEKTLEVIKSARE